jgi:hypothetical protein
MPSAPLPSSFPFRRSAIRLFCFDGLLRVRYAFPAYYRALCGYHAAALSATSLPARLITGHLFFEGHHLYAGSRCWVWVCVFVCFGFAVCLLVATVPYTACSVLSICSSPLPPFIPSASCILWVHSFGGAGLTHTHYTSAAGATCALFAAVTCCLCLHGRPLCCCASLPATWACIHSLQVAFSTLNPPPPPPPSFVI